MSYWDHRKPVRRVRSVDVDEVARAAVKLLDRGGLRALTLRAVADEIGVAPASLYSRLESVDDLFDLALDKALSDDAAMRTASRDAELAELMMAFFHHLVAHRWAGQVIGMRAPRGPAYLLLSERMCVLLEDAGVADPLGTAYRLSNLVLGSALTAPMARDEKRVPIDEDLAPTYARFHRRHELTTDAVLAEGIAAIMNDS